MTSQQLRRLRRLPGRRLVAVPSPAAAPDVWLLLRLYRELARATTSPTPTRS